MSKPISPSRPSIFRSVRKLIPDKMSGLGYLIMLASLSVMLTLLLGVLAFLFAWAGADAPWLVTAVSVLMAVPVILAVVLTIAAFIYGLRIALHLTRTKQWHEFVGFWLDWFAKNKDLFSSVTTDMRVVRSRLGTEPLVPGHADVPAPSKAGGGFLLSIAPRFRFPKRPIVKIIYADDRHIVIYAGSRSGKGRAFIIPNLLHWRGGCIVFDPAAGENYKLTGKYRREVLGQKVVLLDPLKLTGDVSDTWNPLDEVDWLNDPLALNKAGMMAESLIERTGSDAYWVEAPRRMLAMLIAYVGEMAIDEQRSLTTVRNLLMTGELGNLWELMSQSTHYGGQVARFAASNMGRSENELASVMEVARTALSFLDSEPLSDFVQTSTVSMKELKDGQTSIYIVMPAGAGDLYKGWLRLLFDGAFDAMQDTSIPKPAIPTLFCIDEAVTLGRMDRIKRAAGEAAKFGVKLFLCFQSVGQAQEIYGEPGWEEFSANAGVNIMFGNNDLTSLKYLSERLGQEMRKTYSGSSGQGGSSSSWSEQLMQVARPEQAARQASRQSGDAFIFIAGQKPMRLPRSNYDDWHKTSNEEDA